MPITIQSFSYRTILTPVSVAVIASVLTACGGGGSSAVLNPTPAPKLTTPVSTTPVTPVTPAKQEKYRLQYSFDRDMETTGMLTGGDTVQVTVTVLDKTGNIVPNMPLSLSLGDPSVTGLSFGTNVSNAVTDATGQFSAKIVLSSASTVGYRINRTETLQVVVDDGQYAPVTQLIPLKIAGTAFTASPDSISIPGTGTATVTTSATDAKGKALVGANVSLVGEGYSKVAVTDSKGVATFTVAAANVPASGSLSLIPLLYGKDSSRGQTTSMPVTVTKDVVATANLTLSSSATVLPLGSSANLTITGYGSLPADVANQVVSLALTKGTMTPNSGTATLGSAVLDSATGLYKATATVSVSSTAVGYSTIIATMGGNQAKSTLEFYSSVPSTLYLQSSQNNLLPNTSTLVNAVVYDSNGAPVKNATVSFSITSDTSGGNLSSATAITDSTGRAVVTYTAGGASTATDGVTIIAKAKGETGVEVPNNLPLKLTVNGSSLSIAIAADNTILTKSSYDTSTSTGPSLMYYKPYSLVVKDISGNPSRNQPVSVQVNNNAFHKGQYGYNSTNSIWEVVANNSCTENSPGAGPYASPALLYSASSVGSKIITGVTNDQGLFNFELSYPKNYASWITVDIVGSTTVTGSLGSNKLVVRAPVSYEEAKKPETPSFAISPYGTNVTNCTLYQ